MTLIQRRIIYSFFFLLFFLISPLLVLYASGYRLDMATWRLTKVGALYIKTYPAGARVYRDTLYTKRKTPTQIVNMPTGKQTIRVIKDGYQPWVKELRIEPGKTTFAEDIVLFKETFETKVLGAGGETLVPTPDGDLAAYIDTDNKLTLINLDAGTLDNSITLPTNSTIKLWSQDRVKIAYQTGSNWYIVDTRNQKVTPLATYIKSPITSLHFGSSSDDVWILTNNAVWRINTLTARKQNIASSVKDFFISGEDLIRLTIDAKIITSRLNVAGQQEYELPTGNFLTIAEFRNGTALLRGANQFSIWNDGSIQDSISATQYDWRKNKILLTNGYDIWRYDISDTTTTLLDRTGSQPQLIRWHPSQSYITEVVDKTIQILELDNRGEQRHQIFIAPLTSGDYIFDPKGEKIFVLTDQSFTQYIIQ